MLLEAASWVELLLVAHLAMLLEAASSVRLFQATHPAILLEVESQIGLLLECERWNALNLGDESWVEIRCD